MEKIKNYIDLIAKVTAISAVFSVFLGFFVVYDYLSFIEHKNIFGKIISWASSFPILATVYFFYLGIMFLGFASPYVQSFVFKKENFIYKKTILINFLTPIAIIVIYFYFILNGNKILSNNLIFIIFFAVFLPININSFYYYFIFPKEYRDANKFLYINITSLLSSFFSVSFALVLGMLNIFNEVDEKWSLFVMIIFLLLLTLNVFLSTIILEESYNKKYYMIFIFPILFLLIFYMVSIFFVDNTSKKILYAVRFIDKPSDSSWYLLSDNFKKEFYLNGSNGLSKSSLQKIKENFVRSSDENRKNFNIEKYQENALYGYMAWRLGDTKVFCPDDVVFGSDKKENKINAKKCLVIEGRYLQELDSQYL